VLLARATGINQPTNERVTEKECWFRNKITNKRIFILSGVKTVYDSLYFLRKIIY
jgi:hypothetical protein